MFVSASRRQIGMRRSVPLGDTTQTARNIVDAVLPDWWLNWVGGPANTPLSPQQKTDLANAQVRANGIDPATNKAMPEYAQVIQQKYGIDPSDPSAVKATADSIRADALQFVDNYYKSLTAPPPASAFPWGTLLLAGGVLIGGAAIFVKLAK